MSPDPPEPRSSRGRILVVDDDAIICDLLDQVLTSAEYEVTTVLDARSGNEALEAGAFDVVIADLNLPDVRGDRFCRHAREVRPGLRVVLISGDAVEGVAAGPQRYGVDAVLAKPFDFARLLAAVRGGSGD